MTADVPVQARREQREVTWATVAWLLAGAVFIVFRIAGVLSMPVGGAELDHLAGAWQARIGVEDDRFVPTLFQAVTALSLEFTRSELPARLFALAGTASIPVALYRLRFVLGEVAALSAVIILAFDPVSLWTGSSASAMAWDIPISLGVFVLLMAEQRPRWLLAGAGFAAATAGAGVLPLLFAAAAVALARQDYPSRPVLFATGAGALAGLGAASLGFGFGWEGLAIPPILTFAQGFERDWSTEATRSLALLYSTPLLLAGLGAAGYRTYACWRDQEWPPLEVLLLAWAGVSVASVVAAFGSHSPLPLAFAALPLALLLARELPGIAGALPAVEWRYAFPALAVAFFCAFIAEAYVVDWARIDRAGDSGEKLIVLGLAVGVVACLGLLASSRRTAASLAVAAAAVYALWAVSASSSVAFGARNEPLPSPVSSVQGSELRAIALAARAERGGLIVVHPSFEESMTWPFRDSGDLVVSSSVPPDATVAVWPAGGAVPDGFSILDGQWSLLELRRGPDGGFLDYLRWLSNRNLLENSPVPVAVYLRTAP